MTTLTAHPPIAAAPDRTLNIASRLSAQADAAPERPALIVPWRRNPAGSGPARWTFAELDQASNRIADGLRGVGVDRGVRTVVMIRPGLEFTGVIFALFKLGAVPILIDPGMGVARMIDCIAESEPEAFIGVPLAQVVRWFHRRRFPKLRSIITVGSRFGWGGATLDEVLRGGSRRFQAAQTGPHDVAAILFTTGSTGPPKGVVYEHGMFDAQVRLIQAHYDMRPGEVDLPAFPLFALFSTAMGITCVVPEMDPSRPARCDPKKLVRDLLAYDVTTTFGSPAIWRRVGAFCIDRGIRLPRLKRVLTAGAPIPWRVIEQWRRILPDDGDIHTPYGATESLPVTSIRGRELLEGGLISLARCGAGTCVGAPFPGIGVRIIRISDDPVPVWRDDLEVRAGEHGEIVVSGDVVTRSYDHRPDATALHKIREGDRTWHRIGDVGYFDAGGRLWFCGRKAHRVPTREGCLYTIECEAIFNEHPEVFRTALVGVPTGDGGAAQRPVLIVEPLPGRYPRGRRRAEFTRELLELGAKDERTRDIRGVLYHRAFPVDIRHNAKIFRERLARWAAERLS
ncbi:MAG: Long-chain-fatty-acid--CoA ligase FadD13 [Phycisphaerae bacterium]|nr:Long-chain-fatty-acid--CoA ligase FadD13 [Phycisphaerae bacterium]